MSLAHRKRRRSVAHRREPEVRQALECGDGNLTVIGRKHAAGERRTGSGGLVGEEEAKVGHPGVRRHRGAKRRWGDAADSRAGFAREAPHHSWDASRAAAERSERTVSPPRAAQSGRIPFKCVCRRRRNRSYGSPAGRSSAALAVAAAAACGKGMESAGDGIFLRLRMTVMDSVRHMAAGGSAADGRTMSEREAWQRRSFGAARPGRGGPVQGRFGRSPVGSQAASKCASNPARSRRTGMVRPAGTGRMAARGRTRRRRRCAVRAGRRSGAEQARNTNELQHNTGAARGVFSVAIGSR